jgi:hypothetical protein
MNRDTVGAFKHETV